MKRYTIALMLLVILTGCRLFSPLPAATIPPTQKPTSTPSATPTADFSGAIELMDTQAVVNGVKSLCCEENWRDHLVAAEYESDDAAKNEQEFDTGAAFLDNLEAAGERFDANQYFEVLTHLEPEDGYVLDYVYFAPGGDGLPYLYARQGETPPYATYSEYEGAGFEGYLSHIKVDGSAQGFFELALLSVMGEQFYLSWHAEYNDREVVNSRERLVEIIDWLNEVYAPLTDEQVEDILNLDVTPKVKFEGEKVQVRTLVFTKWGGFYERIFTIDRDHPHQIVVEDIQLVPYNCGVMF